MRAFRLILPLAVLACLAASAHAQAASGLTGTWHGSQGTVLVVTQRSATSVSWVARSADGKTWANEFSGTISGSTITGTYTDLPGYTNSPLENHGSATVRIDDDCHMTLLEVTIIGKAGTASASGERYTKAPCPTAEPVPIGTVSNGCGGSDWKAVVKALNFLGNTSTYYNSNDLFNPLLQPFTVSFLDACDLHDAGYAGAVVRDKLRGGIKDFRRWTRKRVDDKFLADMRLLCERAIPATERIALENCRSTGGNASVGAESRYNVVRRHGHRFFDADLSRPGTQRQGPRASG